ncbi:divalent-cation tolerance protein CutA [Ramlibacter henchirensis]|uniref:Divalent-cation tolerance protein CutA n=2 Tax=Ramlibacter henchirensis TaxID=204072 RepID=A0A4Z0C4E8_9BURK|nr:divalent-cation tolerance protein CutA [Ramlibacter henchirensis]
MYMYILSLTTTVANRNDAERLARALLEQRLAACVQLDEGVQSHYRWQGALCAETEVRLTIKTLPALVTRLQAFMGEQHPYEVPQLLWHIMAASEGYADWVRGEVEAG